MTTSAKGSYSTPQRGVPPEFLDVLKEFTKAAMRTKPTDILGWSATYFQTLSKGEKPPATGQMEIGEKTGLTPSLIKVLNKQFEPETTVSLTAIKEKWIDLGLPEKGFVDLVQRGNFSEHVEWYHFLILAVSSCGNSAVDVMKIVCEVLTADSEGGFSRIPFPIFKDLFQYFVKVNGKIVEQQAKDFVDYLEQESTKQEGYVMPQNFLSPQCPRLS